MFDGWEAHPYAIIPPSHFGHDKRGIQRAYNASVLMLFLLGFRKIVRAWMIWHSCNASSLYIHTFEANWVSNTICLWMQSFRELLRDPKVKAIFNNSPSHQGEKLYAINRIFSARFQHLKWWNGRFTSPLFRTLWNEIRCVWSYWSTRYLLPVHRSTDK